VKPGLPKSSHPGQDSRPIGGFPGGLDVPQRVGDRRKKQEREALGDVKAVGVSKASLLPQAGGREF